MPMMPGPDPMPRSTPDAPGGATASVAATTRRGVLRAGAGAVAVLFGAGPARAAHVVRPWAADKPVPHLELPSLDGPSWSLAAQRGRVVVANFWATWCEPCRAEMPSLERMAQRLEPDDVVVVAVNYQETLPAIRRFLAAQSVSLPILLDRDGAAALAWTPRVFPSTVLIDREGRPRHVVLGELDWTGSAARALLDPLAERPKKA